MARWGKGKLAIIPALAALVAAIGYLSFLGGQAAAEEDYIRETLAVYHGAGETGDSLDLIVGVNYDFSAVPIPHTLPAGCRAASPATVTWAAPEAIFSGKSGLSRTCRNQLISRPLASLRISRLTGRRFISTHAPPAKGSAYRLSYSQGNKSASHGASRAFPP